MIRPISYSISFLGQASKKPFSKEEKATFIEKTAHDAVEKYDCAPELIAQINKLMLNRQKENELLSYVTNLALKTERDFPFLYSEMKKYQNNVEQLIKENGLNGKISATIDDMKYEKEENGPLTITQHYKGKPFNWDWPFDNYENRDKEQEERRSQKAYVYFDKNRDWVEYEFRNYNLNDDYANVDMDIKDGKVLFVAASRDWAHAGRTVYRFDEGEKLKCAKYYLSIGSNLKRNKLDKEAVMTFDDSGKISTIYYGIDDNVDDLSNAEHIYNRLDDKHFVQIK